MANYSFLLLLFFVRGFSVYSANLVVETYPADEEVLFQILSLKVSEIDSLVQSGRKFLQVLRQWQGSHPAESRLARCVVRYWIDTKIPGVIPIDDGRRGLSMPIWIQEPELNSSGAFQLLDQPLFKTSDKFVKKNNLKAIYLIYIHLRDLFSRYKLLGCSFQYLVATFWEWIDSAP